MVRGITKLCICLKRLNGEEIDSMFIIPIDLELLPETNYARLSISLATVIQSSRHLAEPSCLVSKLFGEIGLNLDIAP